MKLKHPVTGFVRDVADEGRARTLQHRGYEPVPADTPIGLATTEQPGKGREGVPVTERAEGEQSMKVAETDTGTTAPPPPPEGGPGAPEGGPAGGPGAPGGDGSAVVHGDLKVSDFEAATPEDIAAFVDEADVDTARAVLAYEADHANREPVLAAARARIDTLEGDEFEQLTGDALAKAAAEAEIEGRSKMTADQLRQALRDKAASAE